ncbi:MAG: acetylglutamate kinase [Bacteroidia bacterium]
MKSETKCTIVKLGGNIIDDQEKTNAFLESFASVNGLKILIHGGGKIATELSNRMNIPVRMIDGRRVTDMETLKITVMVYAGWINKNIAAALTARGCTAVGISGADAGIIPATKRHSNPVDYGFVGDPAGKCNTDFIRLLLENNITPVIAPVTSDGSGQLLNTNADTIAAYIAAAISMNYKVNLIYAFEKNGVLNNDVVIGNLSKSELQKLIDSGIINGGMLPKLKGGFYALDNGVKNVAIGSALHLKEIQSGSCTYTSLKQ